MSRPSHRPSVPGPSSHDAVAPVAAPWPGASGRVAVRSRRLEMAGAAADPLRLLEALDGEAHPWLLESARVDERLGRFSLLGADPFAVLTAHGETLDLEVRRAIGPGWTPGRERREGDPFEAVRALWPRVDAALSSEAGRLPFVGGAVAAFGYELAERIERLDLGGANDLATPDLVLLFVDRLVCVDHMRGEVHGVALGFGEDDAGAGCSADAALDVWCGRISRPASGRAQPATSNDSVDAPVPRPRSTPGAGAPVAQADDYPAQVRAILAEIERGQVYEVNLTRRESVAYAGEPLALYRALREESPAPFAAYLDLPGVTLVGSSPERFLRMGADRHVQSRPIKGTRPRGATKEEDAALAEELVTSPKDRAENLMIVDLVRNDLGRVCEIGSVRVPELMQVETYATVFQLVSTVVGRLREDCDGIDLVRACFPPGSMTGAPKIAAMQIAAKHEPVRRGIYSGAVGYLDARGGLDLSVVIRSLVVKKGRAYLHVGGAVVADSDPAAELEETRDKARAMHAALARVEAGD